MIAAKQIKSKGIVNVLTAFSCSYALLDSVNIETDVTLRGVIYLVVHLYSSSLLFFFASSHGSICEERGTRWKHADSSVFDTIIFTDSNTWDLSCF